MAPLNFLAPDTSMALLNASPNNLRALERSTLHSLAGKNPSEQDVDAAAGEFESMVLAEMLRPMFDTVDVDPTFGGGHAEEIFRSLLVDEYGKSIAANGGIGIAAQVKAELIKLQEAAGNPVTVASDTGTPHDNIQHSMKTP